MAFIDDRVCVQHYVSFMNTKKVRKQAESKSYMESKSKTCNKLSLLYKNSVI